MEKLPAAASSQGSFRNCRSNAAKTNFSLRLFPAWLQPIRKPAQRKYTCQHGCSWLRHCHTADGYSSHTAHGYKSGRAWKWNMDWSRSQHYRSSIEVGLLFQFNSYLRRALELRRSFRAQKPLQAKVPFFGLSHAFVEHRTNNLLAKNILPISIQASILFKHVDRLESLHHVHCALERSWSKGSKA